jgi:hypothetical protein
MVEEHRGRDARRGCSLNCIVVTFVLYCYLVSTSYIDINLR